MNTISFTNNLPNEYLFTETIVKIDELFNHERDFIVTGIQPAYKYDENNQKTEIIENLKVTLMCIKDNHEYGKTKAGKTIDNIEFKPFNIKIQNLDFNVPKKTRVKVDPKKVIKATTYQSGVTIILEDLEVIKNEKQN